MLSELSVLEVHLEANTWLVGNAMTLADVVSSATVKYFFENVLDGGKRKSRSL